jgi:hypothetical protein
MRPLPGRIVAAGQIYLKFVLHEENIHKTGGRGYVYQFGPGPDWMPCPHL